MKVYIGVWVRGALEGKCWLLDQKDCLSDEMAIFDGMEVDIEYPSEAVIAEFVASHKANGKAKRKARLLAELEDLDNE